VKRRVAVVGKGLTFDSGGYNLKAGAGSMIEMMKFDMGGSGATLGAAKALSLLQPEGVEVHFIVAACENMVDGRGLRPGDVLVASNGKTVEINNTDAEGRLTLADALLFAQKQCGAGRCSRVRPAIDGLRACCCACSRRCLLPSRPPACPAFSRRPPLQRPSSTSPP
jgi:leucyl aminopeptidase